MYEELEFNNHSNFEEEDLDIMERIDLEDNVTVGFHVTGDELSEEDRLSFKLQVEEDNDKLTDKYLKNIWLGNAPHATQK